MLVGLHSERILISVPGVFVAWSEASNEGFLLPPQKLQDRAFRRIPRPEMQNMFLCCRRVLSGDAKSTSSNNAT